MSATTLAYVPSFTAQTDTNDLIAAHLAGDERAFTRLVTRYQPRLVNFVTRMIQDRERAEDLVQEAFLRVYRHLNRFDPVMARQLIRDSGASDMAYLVKDLAV